MSEMKATTKVPEVLESVRNPPQQKIRNMQKPANQHAMQINWLVVT